MIQTSNFPGLGHDRVEKNSLEEGNCNHFSELIPELFFFSWLVCPNFGTWFGCKGWCGDMRGRIHCRNCRCRYVETTAHSSQHWNDILTVNVYIKLLELFMPWDPFLYRYKFNSNCLADVMNPCHMKMFFFGLSEDKLYVYNLGLIYRFANWNYFVN